MRYSRFCHKHSDASGRFAVYNSLLMEVVLLTPDEMELVDRFVEEGQALPPEMLATLVDCGVLVSSEELDDLALERLQETHLSASRRVHLAYFVVSSACNLACSYCFIDGRGDGSAGSLMTPETARQAMREYCEYLQSEGLDEAGVIFYGGEPMLGIDAIVAAVDEARRTGGMKLNYTVVTNGTLVDSDALAYFKENEFSIGLSVDGPRHVNDRNRIARGANGASTYDAIEWLLREQHDELGLGLSITLAPNLLAYGDDILDWIEQVGARRISYNLYTHTGDDDGDWATYAAQATDLIIRSHERFANAGVVDDRIGRKIESLAGKSLRFADCAAVGGNQVVFKPDGAMCACHGYEKTAQYDVGSLGEQTIHEVLRSPEFDFWVSRSPVFDPVCQECPALHSCGGGCPMQAEALFGERGALDRPHCVHTLKVHNWFLNKCLEHEPVQPC